MKRAGFGSRQMEKRNDAPPQGLVQGTPEQEAVWHALLNTLVHVIVEAVAGSGKTFTLVQYALREKMKRIGLVAFNKHIADELKQKMGGQRNVDCMTYHSLGFRAIREYMRGKKVTVDEYKVLNYLDDKQLRFKDGKLLDRDEQKTAKYRIKTLVGFAKSYGYGPEITETELNWIEERHDVDLNGLRDTCFAAVGPTLQWCKENMNTIDYDDMVWLPYINKLPVPQYDVLCVDEYQDTAITQQWLAIQAGKRVCAVGDSRQAIYAFRGADSRGFERLREQLGKDNVVTLPLTLTRRCPQSHVAMAQTLVPQIRAMETAPQGVVRYMDEEQAADNMKPGDLVMCRVNAPLLATAYKLLKRGTRAVVRGRDLGTGITKLLEAAQKEAGVDATLQGVLSAASTITSQNVSKFMALPNGRGEMRAASAQDKFDCLMELASQSENIAQLKSIINRLFAEFDDDGKPNDAVVLGTVHRSKGLEGNRVFILKPDLIPHPMAKRKQDQEQERNLAYVAVTRAKFEGEDRQGELVFVGGECPLFPLSEASYDKEFDIPEPSPNGGNDDGESTETPEGWD